MPQSEKLAEKVVDAKVEQLKDAVRNARWPFTVALLWSFIIAVALYNFYLSYTETLTDRYAVSLARATAFQRHRAPSPSAAPSSTATAAAGAQATASASAAASAAPVASPPATNCPCRTTVGAASSFVERYYPLLHAHHKTECTDAESHTLECEATHEVCARVITSSLDELAKERIQLRFVDLPALDARANASDLGVIGQAGLLLIGLWFLFASRRENHALRAIVNTTTEHDTDAEVPATIDFKLFAVDSTPAERTYYAYAYHSVAQRFLFLTSHPERVLRWVTGLLIFLPALVALLIAASDTRDVVTYGIERVTWRPVSSVVLAALVTTVHLFCLRYEIITGRLLNAWFLASRDVWYTDDSGGTVAAEIHPKQQRATPYRQQELAPSKDGPHSKETPKVQVGAPTPTAGTRPGDAA